MRLWPSSIILISLVACQETETPDQAALNEYLGQLGKLEQPDKQDPTVLTATTPAPEGDYSCSTVRYGEVRHTDQLLAQISNQTALWPGALLRGDSIATAQFSPVLIDRAPVTMSVNLLNLKGTSKIELDAPNRTDYQEALRKVFAEGFDGNVPAKVTLEKMEAIDKESVGLLLKTRASLPIAEKVMASFDWNNTKDRTRIIVSYLQEYYSVAIDPPSRPHKMFADTVKVDDIKPQIGPKNPALYVSQVSYGRQVLFTFESEYSGAEVKAAFDAAFRYGVPEERPNGLGGNNNQREENPTGTAYADILRRSKINSFIIGGDAASAQKALSYEELIKFIGGGETVDPRQGVPVAFTLAYLSNNDTAQVAFPSEYNVKACVRKTQQVKVKLASVELREQGFWDMHMFGTVSMTGKETKTLYTRPRDEAIPLARTVAREIFGAEQVLAVEPLPGKQLSLSASMKNKFPFAWNDQTYLGKLELPFEGGWRGERKMELVNGDTVLRLTFQLEPL